MKQPAGVILAGGQSTRMGGGDKGLLKLGSETLLQRVTERLEPQVVEVALNVNGDPRRFHTPHTIIQDSIDGFAGPLAGVLAGMDWAATRGHSHIVTVAADTPFFPCDLVPRLLLASESHSIALAATPENGKVNRHPTFGLWPVILREDLRDALEGGLRKVVLWADKHGTALAKFETTPFDPFFNVNSPEDMTKAESYLT
ncbi:MAG: molybdenum cofactor guanylyltransferase MobA [Litoreibacter sp.]